MVTEAGAQGNAASFILSPAASESGPRESGSRGAPRLSPQFLAQKAFWLCNIRWVAVGVAFLLGMLTFFRGALQEIGIRGEFRWSFWCAAFLGLSNLGYVSHLRWLYKRNDLRQVDLNVRFQIVLDLVLVTGVIYFLGTTGTFAPFLYVFHIVLTCIFFPTRRSFVVVILASMLYGGMLFLEMNQSIPFEGGLFLRDQGVGFGDPLRVIVNFTSLFLIWLCVWYLASRLSSAIFRRDRELARSNDKLLRAQAERTKHMLRTTHELKAPFAAIHANTQLLLNGYCGTIPEEALGIIRRIAERSRRLSLSIQNMLELTNVQSVGRDSLKWVDADLSDLLKRSLEQLQPLAGERRITFRTELHSVLTHVPEDHFLMLFANLLQNAVVYSRPEGEVSVSCVGSAAGNLATVIIEDHGIGIPAQKLPRIFEEYYRTEEAVAHNKDSSGIGLAIVQTIARTHGITIRVDSVERSGTKFTLSIPLRTRAKGAASGVSRGARILDYLRGGDNGLHSDRG